MRKILLQLFYFLIIATILASISIFLIGYLKGDDFKNRLVNELNEQLKIEVSVEKIEFSIFDNFPNASVQFVNVATKEKGLVDNHPLLRAEKLTTLFNVLDILRKNYKIESIEIQNAFISIYERTDGTNNSQILDTNQFKDSAHYTINLKKVNLRNVQVSYINEPAQQEYLFRVDDGLLTGQFSKEEYLMAVKGNFYSNHIRSGSVSVLQERAIKIDVQMEVNNQQKVFGIKKSSIYMQGMAFDLSGSISYKNKNSNLNLNIGTKNISIQSLMGLVPPEYFKPIHEYEIEGTANFMANIKGPFSGKNLPEVSFSFQLDEGRIKHKQNKNSLTQISLSGSFTNGKLKKKESFELHLQNINAEMRSGNLAGEISIINFNQPEVKTRLRSRIQINELLSSYFSKSIDIANGIAEFDISFKNKLKSFRKFTIQDFISSQTSGTLIIENVNFSLQESPLYFNDFSGAFSFSNKNLIINQFSGKVSSSNFKMEGKFLNVLPFLFKEEEKLSIVADFQSENINLTELLEYKSSQSDTLFQLDFSDRISFDLDAKIDNLSFKKFNAANITGRIQMNNQKLVVDQAAFDAMQGKVIVSGQIKEMGQQGFEIKCNADISNVSIEDLFFELGDFGQESITSKHLKGKLNTSINYSSDLSREITIDPDGVYVLAEVEITNGELINYTPMLKLSKFIKEEELEHIHFSKLQNTIKIEEKVIYIPEMEIESSALNISLNGTHTFDNDIDYHAWIELAELRSEKKQKLEEIEGIIIEDDGLGKTSIPVKMTGKADAPDISFDVKAGRKKISNELKKERENLKKALRKEFGGKDRNDKEKDQQLIPNQNNNSDFIIDWEELKKDSVIKPPIKEKTIKEEKKTENQQQDFIIEWDEEEGDTL